MTPGRKLKASRPGSTSRDGGGYRGGYGWDSGYGGGNRWESLVRGSKSLVCGLGSAVYCGGGEAFI